MISSSPSRASDSNDQSSASRPLSSELAAHRKTRVSRDRVYPSLLTRRVNENMLAAGFSKVSKETLGVYPGVEGRGGEDIVEWSDFGDKGVSEGIGDMSVRGTVVVVESIDQRLMVLDGRERSLNHSFLTMSDEHERPTNGPASDSTGPQQEAFGEKGKHKAIEEESASKSASPDVADEVEEEEQGSSDEAEDSDQSENNDEGKDAATSAQSAGAWQAIYSPQYNAYYFYNAKTQETTWTNPLAASNSASASTSAFQESDAQVPTSSLDPRFAAMQEAAIAHGIDPALAYLDPSLGAPIPSASVGPGGVSFAAKFNARTGQFTRPDGRNPTHVSEYERMKRMSQFYFDVGAWETQLAAQGGSIKGDEATKKRKRPSKKDLERFKEQKRLKKIAKTAWLRT
ncbi:hypothetical protein APHAL10511_005559 [Amanita phalloides]|nr:hypothetical protein APHAL10511_005559 [Amanita phalloides]